MKKKKLSGLLSARNLNFDKVVFFNIGTEKTGESHPGRTPANSALEANQELNPQQLRSF